MKSRRVYTIPDLAGVRRIMAELRDAGIDDDDIALVARADIEMEAIPDGRKEADTDFGPAAAKGVGIGAGTGLLAGLAAVVVPPLGLTLAGTAIATLTGAAVGGWVAALIGSTVEDPVRRRFHDQIEAGRLLLVIDEAADRHLAAQAVVERHGGTLLSEPVAPPPA